MKQIAKLAAAVVGLTWLSSVPATSADLTVPNTFGDSMVIQRDAPIHVRGTARPGANVRVILGPRDLTVRAGEDGRWSLDLEALPASAQAKSLLVRSEQESVEYDGIVVGDVWLLGGQSNMEDVLEDIYHGDTEVASANFPLIRLMTIPAKATPRPQSDMARINEYNSWTRRYEMKGSWTRCTPKAVRRFSAIGYVFGRRLHMVSGVPIGLIDASVGGTTVEAWTSRGKLEATPGTRGLLEEWDSKVAAYDAEASLKARIERWEKDTERRKSRGEKPNPRPTQPDPDPAGDRNNPGASYNAMIAPLAGFRIAGAIFNQGYNNALGNSRPRLYAQTLKAMIEDWRAAFRDEEMPFGIVGLTAGGEPQTHENFEIRMVDAGPFIREAQHRAALELEGVCFMPAYDQQVPWYHPHKKLELGERIARWALNTRYGQHRIGWKPVECIGHEVHDGRIVLRFDRAVRVHDGRPFEGFAIAGEDRHFVPAKAEFVVVGHDQHKRPRHDEKRLVVSSPLVPKPVAVRYAWARNPIGNAVNSEHHQRIIPIPSFRTDDWNWPEAPFKNAGGDAERRHRQAIRELRETARAAVRKRRILEAKETLRTTPQKP